MRMWMVPPMMLSRARLLGEHGEIHKHRHIFERGYSIWGRLIPEILIEPKSLKKRHDELAKEMVKRGYNHNSPFEDVDISHYPSWQQQIEVDWWESIVELCNRDDDCVYRITGVRL